jgi:hypothetical protein
MKMQTVFPVTKWSWNEKQIRNNPKRYCGEANMTITLYVKTADDPKTVADVVCRFNYYQGEHPEDKYSWVTELRKTGEEEYWEIKGKYAPLKDLTLIGLAYRTGDTVVLGEVDDDLAENFLDPLLEKYGFDNIKWIVIPPKR